MISKLASVHAYSIHPIQPGFFFGGGGGEGIQSDREDF